jgi:hypothetical protein
VARVNSIMIAAESQRRGPSAAYPAIRLGVGIEC